MATAGSGQDPEVPPGVERLVPDPRLEARAAEDRHERVVQPRRDLAREQVEVLVRERRQRDLMLARERMGLWQERDEALIADRGELELRGDLGAEGHRDVDAAAAEGERHPRIPHLLRQELDVRVAGPERPAERRQRLEAGAPRVGDPQPPERAGRRAFGVLGRPLGVRQSTARSRKERASGVGEPHLAGRPWKSSTPRSRSSWRIAALSGGWAMCSRCAARLKFSSSATAMK